MAMDKLNNSIDMSTTSFSAAAPPTHPHHQSLPLFSDTGTTLDAEQQVKMAKKKGLCIRCGIKTHSVLPFRKVALTNRNVYQGHCIRCEPDLIPIKFLQEWESSANPEEVLALAKSIEFHNMNNMRASTSSHVVGSSGSGGASAASVARAAAMQQPLLGSPNSRRSSTSPIPPGKPTSIARISAVQAQADKLGKLRGQLPPAPPLNASTSTKKDYQRQMERYLFPLSLSSDIETASTFVEDNEGEYEVLPLAVAHPVVMGKPVHQNHQAEGRPESTPQAPQLQSPRRSLDYNPNNCNSNDILDNPEEFYQQACQILDHTIKTRPNRATQLQSAVLQQEPQQAAAAAEVGPILSVLGKFLQRQISYNIDDDLRDELVQVEVTCLVYNITRYCRLATKPDNANIILPTIIETMQQSSTNIEIQAYCIGILRNMSLREDNNQLIADLGGIPLLIRAMNNTTGGGGGGDGSCGILHRRACGTLQHLACREANEIAIGQQGGITAIIKTILQYKTNVNVLLEAFAALRNVSVSEENKSSIAQHTNDFHTLIQIMSQHSAQAMLQQKAFGAIRSLTGHTEFHKPLLGGMNVIVFIMDQHLGDDKIQTFGCGILKNLSTHVTSKLPLDFGEPGIRAILNAVQCHNTNSPKLASQACIGLRNIAKHSKNREIISQLDGSKIIIESMESYLSDVSVQREACEALLNLSMDKGTNASMGKLGGISVILRGMKHHKEDSGLQASGCGILWSLSAASANHQFIVTERADLGVITAMKLHKKSTTVQKKGCLALASMAAVDKCRDFLCQKEVMEVVAFAIESRKDTQVQKYAFKYLATMLTCGSSACVQFYTLAISQHEPALRQAIREHGDNPELKKFTSKLLFPAL